MQKMRIYIYRMRQDKFLYRVFPENGFARKTVCLISFCKWNYQLAEFTLLHFLCHDE